MPVVNVSVKWGKQKYDGVQLDTNEPAAVFKAQLYTLTGVEPDRQKVMVKGGMLKDDDAWGKFDIKEGHSFMLMGTAGTLPAAPVEKPAFIEDMSEAEIARALPVGLVNMGNTCYMNATVQCLRAVPEFRQALERFAGGASNDVSQAVTVAMRDLYRDLDRSGDAVQPFMFLNTLHRAVPSFAQLSQQHQLQQQDAQECWVELLRFFGHQLPQVSSNGAIEPASQRSNFIQQHFGGQLQARISNTEIPEEPSETTTESFLQLQCHISAEVNFLSLGLRNSLTETLTKNSSSVNRDCVYRKLSQISRLPSYLTVNMVRFEWKGSSGAKILRNVKFDAYLDVFELCTPELQERLKPMRTKFKAYDDAAIEKSRSLKNSGGVQSMDTSKDEVVQYEPSSFEDDIGSNNSGYYELQAVLSHKGRSANSGHYLGWVRQNDGTWLKFDDDTVYPVNMDEVLKLSGGGDWHMGYMLLYGPRRLPKA
ncbi:ubiquitin specific peptidase 14 [Capsaspora owczarzaki ATCC 30864]|uniref:Ubiquitin carboxyl-terminal hydrolase n=1 Tax=Capsaspora owczarzaki (strain ATCC 30864) TaxID=595528 RepID=A0A0D2X0E2_CAPO3|nr:ubiquitin specific peptidase 14 [Capsaspora owczarzaki ATCC 30864]